jgi:hypothetical protein
MKSKLFFYILIPLVVGLMILIFERSSVYGQLQSNYTSRVCNADGTCITTMCINSEPCRTIKSNSTSGNGQGNSTSNQNNTEPLNMSPGQII